jgi:hypothetical protein
MKKILPFLFLVWAVGEAYAQDDYKKNEIRTLFSGQKSLGFYGSFSLGYSQINGKDALVSGARGGMIFNHATAIGFGGYGFINNMEGYRWEDENLMKYSLAGGYGGIFVEPIVGGLKPVHLAFPVLFGLGGVAQVRNYGPGYWNYPHFFETPENDIFFIVEPAVELEFNLARFFRTAATVSYRYTSNIDLFGVDEDVLRGFHFGLIFKFGKF